MQTHKFAPNFIPHIIGHFVMGMNLYIQHCRYLQACYMVVTWMDTWNFFIILSVMSISFASLTIVMFMSQHHHSIKMHARRHWHLSRFI